MTPLSQSPSHASASRRRTARLTAAIRRLWPATGLVALIGACWAYMIETDLAMRRMDVVAMMMPRVDRWALPDFALVATMWLVMMIAMMVPSATPMLLAHRQVLRARGPGARRDVHTTAFLSGYLLVWVVISGFATIAQWMAHNAMLVSPSMVITRPAVAGALLAAAGVYQWTSFKRACLRGCRSPLAFLVQHWRDGALGAFRMGAVHGAYCFGCCGLLMALMLVYGAMNFVWMVAVTAAILAEKLFAADSAFHKLLGAVLIAWGAFVAFS